MPASRIRHGVTKSGSPTPREITSSISAAMSKNLRMPDGGQAAMTSLSGFTDGSSRGDAEPVVGLGLEERVAVALVRPEHEVRGGGRDPVDGRQLAAHEVADRSDVRPDDRAPQVVPAGHE